MTQPNLVPIPELYVSAESAQKLKVEATVSGGGLNKAGKAGKTVTIR